MTLLGKAHADPLLRGAVVSETIVHMGELEFFPRAELKSNRENWCSSSWSKYLTWFYLQDRENIPREMGKQETKWIKNKVISTLISYQGILPVEGLWENKQEDNV